MDPQEEHIWNISLVCITKLILYLFFDVLITKDTQLTLEQHGFECHRTTYRWIFFIKCIIFCGDIFSINDSEIITRITERPSNSLIADLFAISE